MTKKFTLIAFVLVMTLAALTSCSKDAVSTADFIKAAEKHGCITEDYTDTESATDEHKALTAAINEKDGWVIGFHEFKEESKAEQYFTMCKKEFLALEQGGSATTSSSGSNFDTYSLSSGGFYMYASRIANTVIYINVPNDCKDAVKAVVEEIGY